MAKFYSIDNVKVGKNKSGTIKSDSVIYAIISAGYNVNYTSGPSTFSLTVVSADSTIDMDDYLKKCGTFSPENVETIKIERPSSDKNEDTTIFTFLGFLTSYTESISAGERTYQLEYQDRSIILDKIFVGLTNRHQKVNNPVGGTATVSAFCGKQGALKPKTVTVPFGLDRSESARRHRVSLGPKLNWARYYEQWDPKNVFAGGLLTLGDEQFSENFCQIPDVNYTFRDLLFGLNKCNIEYSFLQSKSSDLAVLDKNGIRRQYTGTLRSVLSSMCQEYSLTYVWNDVLGKEDALGIQFFDLRVGINNIKHERDTLLSLGVENLEYSVDTSSTKSTGIVTRVLRPPTFSSEEINFTRQVNCSPVTLKNLNINHHIPVRNDAFLISCMLAKINPDLRTLYYSEDDGCRLRDDNMGFEAIGIYFVARGIDFINATNDPNNKSPLRSFFMEEFAEALADFGNNIKVSIVYRSQDMEDRFVEWEKTIADNFLGKYFRSGSFELVPDTTTCSAIEGRRLRVADSEPPFTAGAETVIPEISNDPYGAKLSGTLSASTKFFKTIKRDNAPWQIDPLLGGSANAETEFKHYVPRFIPATPEAIDLLIDSGVVKESEVKDTFALGGAEFRFGFLLEHGYGRVLSIDDKQLLNNFAELPASSSNQSSSDSDTSKCTPNCSVDMASFICGDEFTGSNYTHGPIGRRAFGITVSLVDGTGGLKYHGTAIAPVGSTDGASQKYKRLEKINFKNFLAKRGIKEFLRQAPVGVSHSASLDMVEQDMTSNLLFTADSTNKIIVGETYITTDGETRKLMAGSQKTVAKALEEYHSISTKGIASYTAESQTLNVTIPGHKLPNKLEIDKGLSSMNFSITSSGTEVKLVFRSMPPQHPNRELSLLVEQERVNTHRLFRTLTTHYNKNG